MQNVLITITITYGGATMTIILPEDFVCKNMVASEPLKVPTINYILILFGVRSKYCRLITYYRCHHTLSRISKKFYTRIAPSSK